MHDFLTQRLLSHRLLGNSCQTPAELVRWYGCLQAQDIPQALRCLGSRVPGSTVSTIKEALTKGEIIRTRPMRGTLHYMDPAIVHRMLDLCASKTLTGFAKRRAFLGINDAHAERALELMERALKGGKTMTRSQINELLLEGGIPMQTQRVYHLTCYAATRKLICFGPPNEKEETFVLLDERVKKPKILTAEEQGATLARTYLRSHGPATADDLARRTGLGKTICKQMISSIQSELITVEANGKTYFAYPSKETKLNDQLCLLGGFDEYFIGYKDRSPVADTVHHGKLFTTNGIFFPLIVVNGTVVGVWKRTFKKDLVDFAITIVENKVKFEQEELMHCASEYAAFRGKKLGKVEWN